MHPRITAIAAVLALVLAAAQAPLPPPSTHPLIEIDHIASGVKSARMEVQLALADPAAAFESYLAKFLAVSLPKGHPTPGGPLDRKSKADRLEVFTANLQRAAARNAASSSQLLAYGITPFMHLTQEEYEVKYLGQTAESKAQESLPLEYTWAAADAAMASRKLLARTQTPVVPLVPVAAAPTASAFLPGDDLLPTMPIEGTPDALLSDLELPAPPAAAAGAAAMQSVAPAQQLPAHLQDAVAAVGGLQAGLPTLPMDPTPGANGCIAQRLYPYAQVVPPADGVNWVTAGGTTAVKDQGLCGSCVAFATTALAEFMHMRKYGTTNTTTDLSEQDLLDCTIGDGCQGQYQTAYVNLIGCSGIAMEVDGPYRVADGGVDKCTPTRRYSGMAHGQGGGWAHVPYTSADLTTAVSQAPVMVTLDATDWALYAGGVLDCDAPGTGHNHAVVVVGYFNNVQQPNGEVWDMFLVRNSFGSWWGSGNGPYAGHIIIRKGCATQGGAGPSALHGLDGIVPLFG